MSVQQDREARLGRFVEEHASSKAKDGRYLISNNNVIILNVGSGANVRNIGHWRRYLLEVMRLFRSDR